MSNGAGTEMSNRAGTNMSNGAGTAMSNTLSHSRDAATAVEQTWHTYASQSQILAVASRRKYLKPFKYFPLGSEAASVRMIS
jgi:hypothetical protein